MAIKVELPKREMKKLTDNLKESETIFEQFARPALAESTEMLVGEIKVATPIGVTRNLAKGTDAQIKGRGFRIHGDVVNPLWSEYGQAMEEGIPRGVMPPYQRGSALERWVQLKLNIRIPRRLRQSTYLVARHIARGRFRGYHFVRKSVEKLESSILKVLSLAVDKFVDELERVR